MTLAVFAVCEQVRLATGAVFMVGRCDLVPCAMGSSRLRGIGLSGGFGMTNLGSGAGGFGMTTLGGGTGGLSLLGRRIVQRMGRGCARVAVVVVVQHWIACCSV